MNHFDDNISHFAYLREQGRMLDILDRNTQEDFSLCAFGPSVGTFGQALPRFDDWMQVI